MKIKRNGKIQNILECPYCGYDEIWQKFTLSGCGVYCTKLDPSNPGQTDNTQMYDGFSDHTQKAIFCVDCQKKIGYIVH